MLLVDTVPGVLGVGVPLALGNGPTDHELRVAGGVDAFVDVLVDVFGEAFLTPAGVETSFFANKGGDEFLRGL